MDPTVGDIGEHIYLKFVLTSSLGVVLKLELLIFRVSFPKCQCDVFHYM